SQRVKELTDGRGVDVVFDCVGATVWDESLASLKPGGRLVITGTTSGSQIPFNLGLLQSRPLTLMPGHRYAVLERIASMLEPGGLLLLDPSEHLGGAAELFVDRGNGAYTRRSAAGMASASRQGSAR